ncbi:MAG: tetratricopeptide repeat protein [Candidatus Aminicenantes bacterium]|nr:tetratricopeptide repeat protein [Candidatus Aminicenantes bacterium]
MKTHRFPFFLLIIFGLLISVQQSAAQGGRGKGRLQGLVLDEEGNPIASAKVFLELMASESAERMETTDKDGKWAMINLGSGNWRLTVSSEGYIPTTTSVFVSQLDRNPNVVLRLKKPEISKDAVITDEASLAYIEQATQLYNEKEYDQALVILEQFMVQNPKAYQVQILMGDCYREKGEIDKAIEVYAKAVEEAKADEKMGRQVLAKGLAALGDAYLRKNDLEKAQVFFKQSVDANPDNETLAYNVGEIYFSNQKLDEAAEYFAKATEIKPEWAAPYYKLGLVSLNKADYEKAKEHFRKFLTLEPEGELAAQAKNILEYLEKVKN